MSQEKQKIWTYIVELWYEKNFPRWLRPSFLWPRINILDAKLSTTHIYYNNIFCSLGSQFLWLQEEFRTSEAWWPNIQSSGVLVLLTQVMLEIIRVSLAVLREPFSTRDWTWTSHMQDMFSIPLSYFPSTRII